MDRISGLSDELLIKVLLFVPTKVVVSTSILSKRWEFLWMWLPKLDYGHENSVGSDCKRLQCFLDRNLPLHRAPVIESFRLDLYGSYVKPESVKLWVVLAVSHCERELEIIYEFNYRGKRNILPSNLYTCKSLVILKLDGGILLDVPRTVFLPSLKTLQLRRSLSVYIPHDHDIDGIVIETPSLKDFKLEDHNNKSHYCLIENMPNLIEAYVDVDLPNIKSLIGSITSVKRYAICSEAMYDEGFVFTQLEHLELCTCKEHSPNLLVWLLKDSSNLQVLYLFIMEYHEPDGMVYLNQPSSVPECMLSCLQTLNWLGYTGAREERDLVVYILQNAAHLKITAITSCESEVPRF